MTGEPHPARSRRTKSHILLAVSRQTPEYGYAACQEASSATVATGYNLRCRSVRELRAGCET